MQSDGPQEQVIRLQFEIYAMTQLIKITYIY